MVRSSVPRMMLSSMAPPDAAWSASNRSSGVRTGLTRGRHDQVALGETGAGGRAVVHHVADEQAVGVGQADGAAQPPGHVVRRDGHAEPR